jgi:hypothetical protein
MSEKPEISLILPAIRKENWDVLYDSIGLSTTRTFELIICGPFSLTPKLESLSNVKYIKDYGSPTRATAIAASLAEGKYMMWGGDDTLFQPGALDKMYDALISMGEDPKNVVCGKYLEGPNGTHKKSQPDYYYRINGQEGFRPCTYSPHLPDEWWIFNAALMHREFYENLGGVDCKYEHLAMAATDFAIRAQAAGADVLQTQVLIYDCDHMQTDHKPVEIAQLQFDEPLIQSVYRDPAWRDKVQCNIDINNWKAHPLLWTRRFR